MNISDFEDLFFKKEKNLYKWTRENNKTAIAQSLFRIRRICNRAHIIQINLSGGKDSTLSFELVMLEMRYRESLINYIKENNITDYEFKDINEKDFDDFEDSNYFELENINFNKPFLYGNSQDAEIIYSDAIKHIKLDQCLPYSYGLFLYNNKIVCGHDILPKKLRDDNQVTFYQYWLNNKLISSKSEIEIDDFHRLYKIDEDIVDAIRDKRKYYQYPRTITINGSNKIICIVEGMGIFHLFYKAMCIAYSDATSYNNSRFIAWDPSKKDIWCRDLPSRNDFSIDIITNYNLGECNLLPVELCNKDLANYNKDQIVNVDGIDCIPNWGFGSRWLGDYDVWFKKNFSKFCLKDDHDNYLPGWSYIGHFDEDGNNSEVNCFNNWLNYSTPESIQVDYCNSGNYKEFPMQIYSLVSLRASESLDRRTILKQSEFYTGEYGKIIAGGKN